MKEWHKQIVLENGQLNDTVIHKREVIYKGMNGKFVERFFTTPTESYIFKPLTNNEQIGTEIWVQENILPSFPTFYPVIIAKSISMSPDRSWIIYRDLGDIKHEFTYEVLKQVIKHMVWWHSLPTEKWKNAPLRGPKPAIEVMKTDILREREEIVHILSTYDLKKQAIEQLFSKIESFTFSNSLVLSHGDLHLGNYGISQQKLVIIDWEHAHINTRFWDLYHVLDLSHPTFPKTITKELRNKIIFEYFLLASSSGLGTSFTWFKHEYYLFSAVFSLWMIRLIHHDLRHKNPKWPKENLKNQLFETLSSLKDCLAMLK